MSFVVFDLHAREGHSSVVVVGSERPDCYKHTFGSNQGSDKAFYHDWKAVYPFKSADHDRIELFRSKFIGIKCHIRVVIMLPIFGEVL